MLQFVQLGITTEYDNRVEFDEFATGLFQCPSTQYPDNTVTLWDQHAIIILL